MTKRLSMFTMGTGMTQPLEDGSGDLMEPQEEDGRGQGRNHPAGLESPVQDPGNRSAQEPDRHRSRYIQQQEETESPAGPGDHLFPLSQGPGFLAGPEAARELVGDGPHIHQRA